MTFTYRLIQSKSGFLAQCLEAEAAGEGPTADEAVESLRKELEEHMFRPDAVAPPPEPAESVIELVLVEHKAEHHLSGPGVVPMR